MPARRVQLLHSAAPDGLARQMELRAMPSSSFVYYSVQFRDRLHECFVKNERPTRSLLVLLKEIEGFLDDVTDESLLTRLEAIKQANRDMLRTAAMLDKSAFQTALKAWNRACNRAVAYTMSPEDFANPQSAQREDSVVLSERQYEILQAMSILKATDPARRKTTEEIAEAAEGRECNPEVFKRPIADLKRRGLVATKDGRGGGCWLTNTGRSLLEQLKKR